MRQPEQRARARMHQRQWQWRARQLCSVRMRAIADEYTLRIAERGDHFIDGGILSGADVVAAFAFEEIVALRLTAEAVAIGAAADDVVAVAVVEVIVAGAALDQVVAAFTKKDVTFQWKEEHEQAFRQICDAIIADPVLVLPDPTKPYKVETDASDYAIGGQLS